MIKKNKKIIFWIFFAAVFCIFIFIKSRGVFLIESLYYAGKIEILNKLTGAVDIQPLNFYIGRTEETVFGPMREVISGLLFTILALMYLKKSSLKIFGITVFLYFIATRPEVLFYPPYGDAIGGPFAEALWLAKHSFDYAGLYYQPG